MAAAFVVLAAFSPQISGADAVMTYIYHPPESSLEGPLAPYLRGMCVIEEQLVAVLDLDQLLRSSDIRQFEETKEETTDGAEVAL